MRSHKPSVLLLPLVTWIAPAHVPEGYLLKPSLLQCRRRLAWMPDIVAGDLAYIRQEIKKRIREKLQVAVVTKMKPDMNIIEPFDNWRTLTCQQGQKLHWLGYDPEDQHHWFGPSPCQGLCDKCWEAATCSREFAYPAAMHETLFGLLPLNTLAAQRILGEVRSWIEPAQA